MIVNVLSKRNRHKYLQTNKAVQLYYALLYDFLTGKRVLYIFFKVFFCIIKNWRILLLLPEKKAGIQTLNKARYSDNFQRSFTQSQNTLTNTHWSENVSMVKKYKCK